MCAFYFLICIKKYFSEVKVIFKKGFLRRLAILLHKASTITAKKIF